MKNQILVSMVSKGSIEIPDDKVEELLQGFRKTIASKASVRDMIEHIFWTMINDRYTGNDFVEGIGSLEKYGIKVNFTYKNIADFEIV